MKHPIVKTIVGEAISIAAITPTNTMQKHITKPVFLPSRFHTKVAALLLLFSGIHFGVLHAAPSAVVNLGTAAGYGVLAGSTVTSTGPTVINGNVGLSPGSAVTGFPPGLVNGVQNIGNGAALQAKTDLATAYNQAAGLAPNVVYAASKDLVGLTLPSCALKPFGSTLAW